MADTTINSLFSSTSATKAPWRSYLSSILVHGAILAILLAITFPVIQEIEPIRTRHVTLIAPVVPKVPPYRPRLINPTRIQAPTPPRVLPSKVLPPPVVKLPEVKTQLMAAAPPIRDLPPMVHATVPVDMPKPAPAPKPEIKTGVFARADLAKGAKAAQEEKVGGFGDPNGVPSQNSAPSRTMVAKVGSFDMPEGTGRAGGGGRGQTGGLKQTSFGTFGSAYSAAGSSSANSSGPNTGAVRTGGFGDAAAVSPGTVERAAPAAKPITTQVELLFKPKPVYTEDARRLKLEGRVSLQVVFRASGDVEVVKVIQGLGHGLDEAAAAAARQVRFRPATRAGVPVDTPATINIVFELT